MSKNLNWLKRLNNDQKGIWGIEYPIGTNFNAECIFNSFRSNCETEIFYAVKIDEVLKFRDSLDQLVEPNISEIFKNISEKEKYNNHSIRIVITDFHNANIKQQCNLIKIARSIQESSESSCQFIFCGHWSYYAFSREYKNIHGHTSSPPAQSKDILHHPPLCRNDVIHLLDKERIIGNFPSELDLIASDFFIEQTAGDEFLIYEGIKFLKNYEGKWTENIEQVLNELVSAQDVIQEINKRINTLEESEKLELLKLIRFHYLVRDYESAVSEKLWLAGLTQRQKLPGQGGKYFIYIASPLINTLVRHILGNEKPEYVAPPNYLCFERKAISTAAYQRISRIENMLRNLIVSDYYIKSGNELYENLKSVKVSSYIPEEQEDLIKLVLFHIRSELNINLDRDKTEKINDTTSSVRALKIDLFESAKDWQNRQRATHAIELAQDNIMHFLTTESLTKVLNNKQNGFYGEGKPFRKEFLATAMKEYTSIRSAVAHNQPIKLSTISRLDDLERKFIDWITVFADKLPKNSQG